MQQNLFYLIRKIILQFSKVSLRSTLSFYLDFKAPCSCKACKKFQVDFRGSHSEIFFKTGVLKSLAKFLGKYMVESLFLKKLQHRYFPVNFRKFLRTLFYIEYLRQLLL